MKILKRLKGICLALLLSVGAAPTHAVLITVDSGWQDFTFADVGSAWSDTFEFTLTDTAWFAVTDAYMSGDRFEFFVDGVSVGATSMPTVEGDQINDDYDAAFADARWSSAEIMLGAGTYQVSGLTLLSPFGSGRAAVQLSSTALGGPGFVPVSEPGILVLFSVALAGLFIRSRK